MDDKQIIELYINRSENAISETAKKYGKYCQYIARSILQNEEDTEECVNDTFLRVWNSIPPDMPECLKTFLGKITRNLAINKLEKSSAEKRGGGQMHIVLDELSECLTSAGATGTGGAAFISGSIENDVTERIAISGAINSFLSELPPLQRKIFVRRYWYMSSVKEIAAEYCIKESRVTVSLFRMRKKLKSVLEKEGVLL